MRNVAGLFLILLLNGCLVDPPKQATFVTQCTEPRPQVCTMEYNPVCAEMVAGGNKEYASACNACADDAVSGYLRGTCPE